MLRLEYCGLSALFTGDCGAEILANVATDTDILKVPHHGSREHTNAAMLEKTTPSAVFIPVGYNNFGHPAEETLRLLEAAGTKVYRGDLHGAVTFEFNKKGGISAYSYKNPEAADGME